jgi:hypothetical protein
VHRVDQPLSTEREHVLDFVNVVMAVAASYDVAMPALVPSEVLSQVRAEVLIDYGPENDPRRLPEGLRAAVLEFCTQRRVLAGTIVNAGWPLVKCCICRCLVAVDDACITQTDCMAHDDEPLHPYCLWGCAAAHQQYMRETLGEDAFISWSTDYHLQSLIDQVDGVLEGRWGYEWRKDSDR